jgi:imidazolonepropionase-like amidohydrolase
MFGKFRSLTVVGSAELFARFVKNGTWQVPTLVSWRPYAFPTDSGLANDPRLKYIPISTKELWDKDYPVPKDLSAEVIANRKRVWPILVGTVGRMQRAGVRIMAGTDFTVRYVYPGFSLHDELALLVEGGLTPMEALQTATRNPAEYLGMLDAFGTVEKGKTADLVLLEANPLEDIKNTRRIAAVMVGGKLLHKAQLQQILADVEAAASKK